MTSNTGLPPALTYIGLAAVIVGAVLLVAPFAPPQAAIFGFIAILLIGASGYAAITITASVLYTKADEALPEIPDEYEDYPVDGETVHAYLEGDMTDEEFERAVEDELESEM